MACRGDGGWQRVATSGGSTPNTQRCNVGLMRGAVQLGDRGLGICVLMTRDGLDCAFLRQIWPENATYVMTMDCIVTRP